MHASSPLAEPPPTPGAPREVVLLGSTGSIGTQALDVVSSVPGRFRVVGLAAGGGDVATLARQAVQHDVAVVAVARAAAEADLRAALAVEAERAGRAGRVPDVLAGPGAAAELAAHPCDVVLNGMTGSVGLGPTLAALDAGRVLALANKESLVAGGELVTSAAAPGQLVPVDSEHSALAQCLRGGRAEEVSRLVLTASGGPFRGRSRREMADVTPRQALAHPTWDMGRVITTNSATLVNKGLELVEAHLLFGVEVDRIAVVVHPQSVVHSMVEFVDGSTLAQCSPPDMRLPIALGLAWPERLPGSVPPCDWTRATSWQFEPLDSTAFPAVDLAAECARRGGGAAAVYNAANEECVEAFHAGRLPFLGIVDTLVEVVAEHDPAGAPRDVAEVLALEGWARRRAQELCAGAEVRA